MQTSNQSIKKRNSQLKTNYRPISLVPICGKILEKIIFDQVYLFLNSNNLISKNLSGFRPGDSAILQLISVTSNIYKSFENHDETRAVFLDISKAFDKVLLEGIIHKLKCNGIEGNHLKFLTNYLDNRHQRFVLNGLQSNLAKLEAGVPQGSVLGPLLFLVYINYLTDNISSNMRFLPFFLLTMFMNVTKGLQMIQILLAHGHTWGRWFSTLI